MQGTIKFYNDQKGFGFILPTDGEEDMFFHITACAEGYDPQQDDVVEYTVGEGRNWRLSAQDVTFVSAGASDWGGAQGDSSEEE